MLMVLWMLLIMLLRMVLWLLLLVRVVVVVEDLVLGHELHADQVGVLLPGCGVLLPAPWRIRHTNPNIENQIFLEFDFLPPKYC